MMLNIKKNKLLPILLTTLLLFGAGAVVFAAGRVIVPDMTFGGDVQKLSLEQAVEIMQTKGNRAETADLNKKSDEAVAKGYAENAESIRDLLEKLDIMRNDPGSSSIQISLKAEQYGATDVNQKIVKLRRDFAKTQLEANYKAELNQIESETINLYYGVLQAAENLRIAEENLTNQKTILANTQKKYKLGTVAKIDTLTAETAVLTAENEVASAETMLNTAKMNFNMLLGYDLMQKVVLTDTLKMVEAPKMTLTEAVESAVNQRNEIKGVTFATEIQEILLKSLKYRYPENSSTYLNQQTAFLQAQKTAEDAPTQIEMEIRIKYMELADKKQAVDVAKATLANAKEGYRLATITYNAGMNTVTDVQEAQIRAFRAGQGVAKAISDYDLAVYEFEHAVGVGTVRLPL